ncbi:hypothetical protein C942_03271 [Photobacterium marinum]|uniref:Uncharacterized protein n=1 Tax=Photobacterium marinum TaxID=1056511 RepID=L8J8P2_9GAMM|nr:hypothetical protein [Photobacterium marinum]ELR63812.1 hypothetical protein C942_03271 [Photobacterium marinum]
MSNIILTERGYKLEGAIKEPVAYLCKFMGLDKYLQFIHKNKEKAFPVLVGVVLYRQLPRIEQQRVLRIAEALGNKPLFGKLQSLIAQNLANPSWNKWCLSDKELRDYFEVNKTVNEIISKWFFTVEPKWEVGFIAGVLFSVSLVGFKGYIEEAAGTPIMKESLNQVAKRTGLKISKNNISNISRVAVIVVVLASVMKSMTNEDMKQAREELRKRGLLKAEDL